MIQKRRTADQDHSDEETIPATSSLSNYPNPFNCQTHLSIDLSSDSQIQLLIYNIRGQCVCSPVSQILSRGRYVMRWGATDKIGALLPSGIYFACLHIKSVDNQSEQLLTHRLLLMK